MSGDEKHFKRFNGEDDDAGKQLKKWKAWAEAKMATQKDFTAAQRGPWIYTLLDGKALEAVEHLSLEDLMKEDAAKNVWRLLQERFPEKESEDQMGEVLGEVFGLAAKEGESMQQWAARVQEVFQRCKRKADVEFPTAAQGWIALNCAGLTEEQRAIVKAKAQGRLELPMVTAALRSCFPQYRATAKAKKPMATLAVEMDGPTPEEGDREIDDDQFADVEAFLADHQRDEGFAEAVEEEEAAEALAASWKERRQEISRFKQSRQFGAASGARKSFRIEIEELKKRTRCRRCGRIGHWAKECRSSVAGGKASGKADGTASSSSGKPHAEVNFVQAEQYSDDPEIHFVGAAESMNYEVLGTGLVSSPGFGVVDSGCGRTLIGESTLQCFTDMLREKTARKPEIYPSASSFRFGNGTTELSDRAVRLPVGIGGKLGLVDAAIIGDQAPLLLGRPTLARLKVILDFAQNQMRFLDGAEVVSTHQNKAGKLGPEDRSSHRRANSFHSRMCPES